jgi:segregation and condensation protein B
MGLIKVVGRKDVIGRPQIYGTTSTFLRTFGLKSLAELPTIQNLRRQFGAMALPKRETRPDEPELPFDDPEIAATTASDEQADGQENDEATVPEEDTPEADDASGEDAPEVGDVPEEGTPEAATPETDAVETAEPSDDSGEGDEAVAEDESPEDQS